MKQHLVDLINKVQSTVDDRFNPETYFNNQISSEQGMLKSQFVLGNLYANGYSNKAEVNFQIFKDHAGWQIWVWDFESVKTEHNQFNGPYYNYDEVREFLSNL